MTPIVAAAVRRVEAKVARSLRGFRLDAADAEDIVQDAFLAALRTQPDLRTVDQLEAWVMTTARNKAINNVTRKAATTRARGPAPDWPTHGSPEDVIDRAAWTAAFQSLSADDQRALVSALNSGPDGLDAASRKRLQRARARLEAKAASLAAVLVRIRERVGSLGEQAGAAAAAGIVAAGLAMGAPASGVVVSTAAASEPVGGAASSPPVQQVVPNRFPVVPGTIARPSAVERTGVSAPPEPAKPKAAVVAVQTPNGPVEWTNGAEDDHGRLVCADNPHIDHCVYWPDARKILRPGG